MKLYLETAYKISGTITGSFSTSFSMATGLLEKEKRDAINSIYGFVRLADEIVDTFHGFDKKYLLEKFENDYYDAVRQGISLNPVLHAFHYTVQNYRIEDQHIQAFLKSMKSDLDKMHYTNHSEIREYIYGSADVVGLMCLKVFCNGDNQLYDELTEPAMKLGSAFQKVNFLRDFKIDLEELGRGYFPEIFNHSLNEEIKLKLVRDIESDFNHAWQGIRKLPGRSRLAVYTAYIYYRKLLRKIKKTPASQLINKRIRIPDAVKLWLMARSIIAYRLKLI